MDRKEWERKLRIIVRTSTCKRSNVLSEYQGSISRCPKKLSNDRNDKYTVSPLTVTGSKMMQFFMSCSQSSTIHDKPEFLISLGWGQHASKIVDCNEFRGGKTLVQKWQTLARALDFLQYSKVGALVNLYLDIKLTGKNASLLDN